MAMMKRFLFVALLSVAALPAQTKPEQSTSPSAPAPPASAQPASAQPASAQQDAAVQAPVPKTEPPAAQGAAKPKNEPQAELKPQTYVRRFSVGLTLTVAPLHMVKSNTQNTVIQSPAFDALYTTAPITHRIGWGLAGQIAITNRFALNANLLIRHGGYKLNRDILEGTDNPNTIADERKHTVSNESTTATFYDLPVTVRFYTKGRHTAGPRGFFEVGGVMRRVNKLSTSVSTTITTATDETTATSNVPAPYTKNIKGFVAGAGLQLIDPVGIRVVPEVRYTRWFNSTFNNLSTISERQQVEAMISLTF